MRLGLFHYVFVAMLPSFVRGGANEPIAPNELGLTAIDCAEQYCTEKDSLLLWLAMENVCFSEKQPYFPTQLATTPQLNAVIKEDLWSMNAAGAVVGIVTVMGLLSGFTAGVAFSHTKRSIVV